jgi:outer membrane protein assembly factor BamB
MKKILVMLLLAISLLDLSCQQKTVSHIIPEEIPVFKDSRIVGTESAMDSAEEFIAKPRELFRLQVSDQVYAPIAYNNGILYVTTLDNTLYALRADTGEIIWSKKNMDWAQSFISITKDNLYLQNGAALAVAINRNTGSIVWQVKINNEILGALSSGVFWDDMYVSPTMTGLVAYALDSGVVIWDVDLRPDKKKSYVQGNWISPVIIGDRLYFYLAGCLHAVNKDGKEDFSKDIPFGTIKYHMLFICNTGTTIIGFLENFSESNVYVVLFDTETSTAKVMYTYNSVSVSCFTSVIDKSKIYISNSDIEKFDYTNNAMHWTIPDSQPSALEQDEKALYYVNDKLEVKCLSKETGKILWSKHQEKGKDNFGISKSGCLKVNGYLYCIDNYSRGYANIVCYEDANRKVYSAVINDDQIRLRTYYTLDSGVIKKLSRGEKVKVMYRSKDKTAIDNTNCYWYYVQTSDKKRGWIYGAFADLK